MVEKNTYWMLHMLFKSFEDVIWDKRDSLWSCFVTTAKWYLPKSENLFISLNWIICSFTSWYWTVHVFEFFNLLLAVLVQLKVDPFPTALWYSTGCGHCSIRRVFSGWKSSILHANSTRKTRAKHTCKKIHARIHEKIHATLRVFSLLEFLQHSVCMVAERVRLYVLVRVALLV